MVRTNVPSGSWTNTAVCTKTEMKELSLSPGLVVETTINKEIRKDNIEGSLAGPFVFQEIVKDK